MPVHMLALAGLAILLVVLGRVIYRFMVFHAERLITCPENHRPAGVRLQAWRAAGVGFGKSDFSLSCCTRWPEKAGCGQHCLSQIEKSPQDCEVRRILARWYQGKRCWSCGQPFENILWDYQKPALLFADKKSVEWERVPVDQLPEVLEQSKPVCFTCHMAGSLIREHPDLVVERPQAHRRGEQRSK